LASCLLWTKFSVQRNPNELTDARRQEWIRNHRRRLHDAERVLDYNSVPNYPCFDSESSHDSLVSSLSSAASYPQQLETSLADRAAPIDHSAEERADRLNAQYPLLPALSCLLALKSALLICVSSPIVLRDPIAAYLLQSIGSRSVDVLLLQTIYWTVSALLSPEEEAEAEEAQEDSSQAISSREDRRLTKPHSRSQEGPWADLDFSAGNRHRQSSDGDLESWPSQWDTRIIVKDPSQEHSLDALRAMTTPALRVHGQTRGSQVQMSRESPPKPLKALRYRHAERGPKEILDDLVTV
jgi:hypothetical protein